MRIYFNDNELRTECVCKLLSRLSGENQRSLANKGKSKSDKNRKNILLLLNGNLQFEQLLRREMFALLYLAIRQHTSSANGSLAHFSRHLKGILFSTVLVSQI